MERRFISKSSDSRLLTRKSIKESVDEIYPERHRQHVGKLRYLYARLTATVLRRKHGSPTLNDRKFPTSRKGEKEKEGDLSTF